MCVPAPQSGFFPRHTRAMRARREKLSLTFSSEWPEGSKYSGDQGGIFTVIGAGGVCEA
jgi:hypothetical protein